MCAAESSAKFTTRAATTPRPSTQTSPHSHHRIILQVFKIARALIQRLDAAISAHAQSIIAMRIVDLIAISVLRIVCLIEFLVPVELILVLEIQYLAVPDLEQCTKMEMRIY